MADNPLYGGASSWAQPAIPSTDSPPSAAQVAQSIGALSLDNRDQHLPGSESVPPLPPAPFLDDNTDDVTSRSSSAPPDLQMEDKAPGWETNVPPLSNPADTANNSDPATSSISSTEAITLPPLDILSPFMSEPSADSPTSYFTSDTTEVEEVQEDMPTRRPTAVPPTEARITPSRRSTIVPPPRQRPRRPSRQASAFRRCSGDDEDNDALAGMGSIRMGTSALVSALTALPWEAETDDETSMDESDQHSPSPIIEKAGMVHARPKLNRMHSSLHTIRPMEHPSPLSSPSEGSPKHHRFRHRQHLDFPFKENTIARRAAAPGKTELSYQLARAEEHDRHSSAEEALHHRPGARRPPYLSEDEIASSGDDEAKQAANEQRRKARLASRLKEAFGLDEAEEVLEELPCWLLRSIMLKGYMFLTRQRICFFAHMPDIDNDVIKSGPLWKKARRTKLSTKYWFMLRNDVLSWYENSNDPYFPKGNVSLQYASSCDSVGGAKFKLRTTERNYTFTADTPGGAEEWVRVINKVIFKRQQEGETVRLVIPLEAVVDIELSPSLEFAETVEVKVVDPEDSISIDSYFFASFPDNEHAYQLLQKLLDDRPQTELPKVSSTATLQVTGDAASDSSIPVRSGSSASGRFIPNIPKIGSVLRPLGIGGKSSDSRVPIAAPSRPNLPAYSDDDSERESDTTEDEFSGKGYPPRQSGPPPPGMEQQSSSWRSSWMRQPTTKLFGTSPSSSDRKVDLARPRRRRRPTVTEVLEKTHSTTDDDFSEQESLQSPTSSKSPKSPQVDDMEEHFHSFFALPQKERLIDTFSGSLYRLIPVHGRFFISTNYFCFRSSHSLLSKTRMIVPIRELYGMKAQKAFRFGHSGLIVIIKGHEELFLEFSSTNKRNDAMALLEDRMESVRDTSTPVVKDGNDAAQYATMVEDLDDAISRSSVPVATVSTPMFNSTTSSLIDFKPEPMRVVCLTIGSRGDVQPYIALCKGLQAEGHTTTIASHGEYREWVEGHGIGFESIGGDPAELMQLCVDNGMFTIAFLKEGLHKFRSWLDDLLLSSWQACQGADLLIESPSAMAGIHIAEALQIPYYRAFTMPWTRTRAYPQAFAVPDHKRGGSYNYMTYVIFDQVFWRAISGQINRWRRNTLHIDATNLDKLQQDKVPFLYNFSPTVVPPPLDWPEWIHVTGYWFLDQIEPEQPKDWAPPVGLLDFIDGAHNNGQKVVYIGFGSIVVSDPQEMTRCVVDAVIESGVCAILSKGWSDRGKRKDSEKEKEEESIDETSVDSTVATKEGADGISFPSTIYPVDSIDHSWLFPRIDAACHHGGAGTTGASLRAGIPTIIKPFFGDQAFWAERVESLGVGSAIRKLTSEHLSDALKEATTNERQIAKARVVGEEIRRERGVAKAIECIYRDLDYAKSLIKPLPSDDLSLHKRISSSLLSSTSSRQKKSHKSISQVFSGGGGDMDPVSDESWSVVSDSGGLSQMSSPRMSTSSRMHTRTPSNASNASITESPSEVDDDSRGSGATSHHNRHHHHHSLSNIVSHLLPHKHDKDKSGTKTPEAF